ncbi:LppM family (lipo)protein [Ruania albidiflava]|uniref:LppM family (lipo)protein n=1 Tax=Ruania albidiflava TaxID=366586 RepID=UPI0003B3820B|nr:hypothetical protein [Ruania albidiflava]
MKALLRPLLALIAVLALAGCFRVDGDLTISTEDTVSGEVTAALDRQAAIAQGRDPDAFVTDLLDEVSGAPDSGVTAEPYEDGDYVGVTLTLTRTPLVQISDATSGMLQITHEGGQYVVSGDFSGLTQAEDEGSTQDSDAEAAPWQADLSITFPNGVTEHDGELSGSTVTWHLSDGANTMNARGPAPGGGVTWVWIAVIVVIVALLATLVWWLLRRRYDGGAIAGLRSAGARMRERHAAARGDATGRISDLGEDRTPE